jgi:DnaK suppressor protein
LENFQKILQVRSQRLKKEDPFSDPNRINDNASADTDASEMSGHDRITALRQDIHKRMYYVKKALLKIKMGKYGICEKCGGKINKGRLMIEPTAELCINCEKKKGD